MQLAIFNRATPTRYTKPKLREHFKCYLQALNYTSVPLVTYWYIHRNSSPWPWQGKHKKEVDKSLTQANMNLNWQIYVQIQTSICTQLQSWKCLFTYKASRSFFLLISSVLYLVTPIQSWDRPCSSSSQSENEINYKKSACLLLFQAL